MFSGFQERHHWLSIPKCSDSSDLAVLRALECVDTGKVAGFAAWADCLSNPFHGHRAAAGVDVFFREIDEFEAGEGLGEEGMDLLRAPFDGRSTGSCNSAREAKVFISRSVSIARMEEKYSAMINSLEDDMGTFLVGSTSTACDDQM